MSNRPLLISALTALALAFGAAPAAATDLTLWMPGSCPEGACLNQALVDGFHKAHPDIAIALTAQPSDSYFTSLLSASLTKTGPDIGVMWPGGYMTQFKKYMLDIKAFVPIEHITSSIGTAYFSEGNSTANATFAAPTENQWYNGFYNKRLFKEAGIAAPPTTWAELKDACGKLKAKGITPIVGGSVDGAAQFQPIFEFSYLATALPLSDWSKLYDGRLKYSNPVLEAQLGKWAELYKAGCYNEDAFNNAKTRDDFIAEKAAMFLGSGSWDIALFEPPLGDKLGVLAPPFSDTPVKATISTAGSGFAVMTYSRHQAEAGQFVAFVLSDEGQKIIANFSAPTRPGFPAKSPAINALVALSTDPSRTNYPMFDNFTQPPVTDAVFRNIAQVLVGQQSPGDALAAVDAAFDGLPEEQKAVKVELGSP